MKKFLKKKRMNEEMALQITSMADIFTILLVFLLKSYATGITTIAPTGDMLLPEAKAEPPSKEGIKLEISSGGILIDSKEILALRNFEFKPGDTQEDGSSKALYQALMSERKKQKLKESDSSLLVMADQRAPYSTVKRVLASLANSGFIDLDLVVVENE